MRSAASSSSTVTIAAAAAALSVVGYMIGYYLGKNHKRRLQEDSEKEVIDVNEYVPLELQNTKFTSELKLAVKLALTAGQRMTPHINHKGTSDESSLEYSTKSNVADIATSIDEDNESMIISEIRRQFPTHKIIGEEMTGTSDTIERPSQTEPTWIIDPVDGTTNFANGLPLTCVSIGLCDPTTGGRPVMACVYVPSTNELFLSIKHCGSYRNKQRIFANSSSEVNQQSNNLLQKAVIVFEFGSVLQHNKIDLLLKVFKRILKHGIRASRSLGSGVLDLCYVAAGGKVDAVYCGVAGEEWKPWDYCAGSLLVEEANGCITTIWEDDETDNNNLDSDDPLILPTFDIYAKSMIAGTNVALVKELRSIIRKAVADEKE